MRRRMKELTAVLLALFGVNCDSRVEVSNSPVERTTLAKVPKDALEKLNQRKVFFGHQSVGNNILGGVDALLKESSTLKLSVKETAKKEDLAPGVLAHARVGKNEQPKTKIDAFVEYLKGGVGEAADVALFKLCYIDFNENTDVKALFEQYQAAIQDAQKLYPSLVIAHVTAPLTTRQTGFKAFLKGVLGKAPGGEVENLKRHEYNELMRAAYKGRVFDLAAFESTGPDGKREAFSADKTTYFALLPQYTDDGGHLNAQASKYMAEQFLAFLATVK